MFNLILGGKIRKVTNKLDALEIDAEQETASYIKTMKENSKEIVQPTTMEEVDKQLIFVPFFPHDMATREHLEEFSTYLNEKDE